MRKQTKGKCHSCLTGKTAYELDSREPMCPYIHTYAEKKCPFYTPLNKPSKDFVSRLLERVI